MAAEGYAEWEEVPRTYWTVQHPTEESGYPTIHVQTQAGGIFAAFSRNDRDVAQRIQCVAFLPEKMIPLETEKLRVYLIPHLPNRIEALEQEEKIGRGDARIAGMSEVLNVTGDLMISITLKQLEEETHACVWRSEPICLEYDFDPEDFTTMMSKGELVKRESSLESVSSGIRGSTAAGNLEMVVKVQDKPGRSVMLAHLQGASNGHHLRHGRYTESNFLIHVSLHHFSPPGPPSHLHVKARTSNSLIVAWDMPKVWGGCSLRHYEIQMCQITNKGVELDWETCYVGIGEPNLHREFGDEMKATIAMNVYACKLRVRAFNMGTEVPSEWAPIYQLMSEKEENAATVIQKRQRGERDRNKARGAREVEEAKVDGVQEEGGMAIVMDKGIDALEGIRKRKADRQMRGWSDFKRVVGHYFLELGVRGGVNGVLFDLTTSQVETLVLGSSQDTEDGLDIGSPLMSLASCGVWVLNTLAHHTSTAHNPVDWIKFMNEVEGLVNMAAKEIAPMVINEQLTKGDTSVQDASIPMVRSILYALYRIYETIRQCAPEGFVSKQLQQKYAAEHRKQLKNDVATHAEMLKDEIATNVMAIVLYNRQQGLDSDTDLQEYEQHRRREKMETWEVGKTARVVSVDELTAALTEPSASEKKTSEKRTITRSATRGMFGGVFAQCHIFSIHVEEALGAALDAKFVKVRFSLPQLDPQPSGETFEIPLGRRLFFKEDRVFIPLNPKDPRKPASLEQIAELPRPLELRVELCCQGDDSKLRILSSAQCVIDCARGRYNGRPLMLDDGQPSHARIHFAYRLTGIY